MPKCCILLSYLLKLAHLTFTNIFGHLSISLWLLLDAKELKMLISSKIAINTYQLYPIVDIITTITIGSC